MTETYDQALRWAAEALAGRSDADGARYVLEIRGGFSPSGLQLHRGDAMPPALWTQFQEDVARLQNNEPPQYIVGVAPFYGDLFNVTPAVLIPRFETEELVAWAAEEEGDATRGLDVGTGSGVIGLTLAQLLPNCRMTLSDVSSAALAVAETNATRLKRQVTFVQSDLFAALGNQRFDFVIANLPYIARSETPVMDASTLKFEPDLALFAEDEGLALFRTFTEQVGAHLTPGGRVYLEFGYHQQPALAALFAAKLPDATATFRQDMAGHPRMVRLAF
ncbi:peptide chain release factor N(5)-glutamine methyltransferase [Lacticaseibacillus yichunensis]|uniref:Release factor glutamine methyltransferase n=1 Tax=Lacticaseibacillus yichunensis TaxID=2486015 RepID=A0ABW4CQ64_9LACO|nr:peptide chain release factor N(5)-glutamine methyltransferase [Lacticaseibacillus yichunensis]